MTVGWICFCHCPDRKMYADRSGHTIRLCRRRRAADTCVNSSTIGRPGGFWWSPCSANFPRNYRINYDVPIREAGSIETDDLTTTIASLIQPRSVRISFSFSGKNRIHFSTHAPHIAFHRMQTLQFASTV